MRLPAGRSAPDEGLLLSFREVKRILAGKPARMASAVVVTVCGSRNPAQPQPRAAVRDALIEQVPVQAAVLDRFEQVVRSDRIRAGENGGPGAMRARMPTCQESRHDVFGLVLKSQDVTSSAWSFRARQGKRRPGVACLAGASPKAGAPSPG